MHDIIETRACSYDCLNGYVDGGFKGIVLVAYGSGNVNEAMYNAIAKVIGHGLKVVLVTNCKYGGIYSEYGGIGGNSIFLVLFGLFKVY